MENEINLPELDDNEFIDSIIIPSYYQVALHNSSRFRISDNQENIIICSNDWANQIGYDSFKDAMFKRPGEDFERLLGTKKIADLQMNYLQSQRRTFSSIYKDDVSKGLYIMINEPLLNLHGEVIGKKETDVALRLPSYREIIEVHFKKYDIRVASLENIALSINLTEKEGVVLFMLISGYSQLEIGTFLGISRSYVFKMINESLCAKFGLTITSTKLLVETAISLGYSNFIPDRFMKTLTGY